MSPNPARNDIADYHPGSSREWLDAWESLTLEQRKGLAETIDLDSETGRMIAAMCPPSEVNDIRCAVNNALDSYTDITIDVETLEGPWGASSSPLATPKPHLISLDDITVERIKWLWPGYIPRAKLTDGVGDGDVGKTLIMLDTAARISRGEMMPDGFGGGEPANVVLMVAEDDLADTVVPRLIAAGADLARIKVLEGPREGVEAPIVFPDDLPAVEAAIRDTNAALLIIDPVMAFLGGGVKSGIDAAVRASLMGPLKIIAARYGCAVLLIRHTNKSEGASASMRGGGSVAFRNACRAGLAFGPDHDDEDGERRIMVQSKKNLSRQRPALAYRIQSTFGRVSPEGPEGTPVVVWEGVAEGATAASVLGPAPKESSPRAGSKAEAAVDWIRNRLAGGTAVAASVIHKEMAAEGFSEKVVRMAREHAGVQTERISVGSEGKGGWLWSIN